MEGYAALVDDDHHEETGTSVSCYVLLCATDKYSLGTDTSSQHRAYAEHCIHPEPLP